MRSLLEFLYIPLLMEGFWARRWYERCSKFLWSEHAGELLWQRVSSLCNSVRDNEEENPPRGPFRGSAESGNRTFFLPSFHSKVCCEELAVRWSHNRRLSWYDSSSPLLLFSTQILWCACSCLVSFGGIGKLPRNFLIRKDFTLGLPVGCYWL